MCLCTVASDARSSPRAISLKLGQQPFSSTKLAMKSSTCFCRLVSAIETPCHHCGRTKSENQAKLWHKLLSGAANLGCSPLSADLLPATKVRSRRESRLKGGCRQDCPIPHTFHTGRNGG